MKKTGICGEPQHDREGRPERIGERNQHLLAADERTHRRCSVGIDQSLQDDVMEIQHEQHQKTAKGDEVRYLVFLYVFDDIRAARGTKSDGRADERACELEAERIKPRDQAIHGADEDFREDKTDDGALA